jgi:hypothetical protein
MQISAMSLTLTWPCRLCLLRVPLCMSRCYKLSPFQAHCWGVTLYLLSQASFFIYSSRGKWAFSPLLWSFPPTATFTSFPAPDCWECATAPAFSGLACLFTAHVGSGTSPLSCGVCLPPPLLQYFPLLIAGHVPPLLPSLASFFIYSSGRDSPPPFFGTQGAPPSLLCVFFFLLLLIIQFFFFFCYLCLFFCYCLLFSFSFFPGWKTDPGGQSVQGLC